jgi:lipoic acid synthetase
VAKGSPQPVDADEPRRIAEAARALKLRHVVVTSVTRDDLPDGGAGHYAETIRELRLLSPVPGIEVLTPDFGGHPAALETVLQAAPDVFNHNIETVPRFYRRLRPGADYRRSLDIIAQAKKLDPAVVSKSGIMVGFGERQREVLSVMRDLRLAGCEVLTIGQYLAPSPQHLPVKEYISPETFSLYRRMARDEGFRYAASTPLTRSSYRAGDVFEEGLSDKGLSDETFPDESSFDESLSETPSHRRTSNEDHHHRQALRDRSGSGGSCPRTPHDVKKVF